MMRADNSSSTLRRAVWIRNRLICVAVLAALMWWVVATVQRLRLQARESSSRGRLSQIALALRNYHHVHGHFPPRCIYDGDGKPMHSWRVLILPFCGGADLYERYDLSEPWNGPNNARLAKEFPVCWVSFRSPNDFGGNPNWTSYLAIETSEDVETCDELLVVSDNPKLRRKIVLVERHRSGIHWMEPRDLPVERASSGLLRLSPGVSRINFLTTTGQVGVLDDDSIRFHRSDTELLREWLPTDRKEKHLP